MIIKGMTLPALLSPREPTVLRLRTQRAAAAASILTTVSIAVFAALSASGDGAIVAPIGPSGPFADLHLRLAPVLVKAACWLAAACGGAGVMAGLAAVRHGWRPRPGLVLAACAAAAVVFVFVPPAASVDVQNYAEYGRIVVLGHSPWVMTPQQLYLLHDPVGLLRPSEWRNQPTVYGPAATALEAAAAWLGDTSMAWITFWIKVLNGVCYVAVAAVLDRLAGPDPARRARAGLLWAVNPLMLFWMVAGAHTDLLAALPLVLALLAVRTLRKPEAGGRVALAAGVAGALAGIAIAVKVTFAAPVAGLAAGLWQAVTGRRRTVSLASGAAGGALVLAGGYAVAGKAALRSLSQRLSSVNDLFVPIPRSVSHHPHLYAMVLVVAVLIVGGVLAWRMPPGPSDFPEIRPMLICALAVVLGGFVQYPWYDAMFFPLLALLPASRLDSWLVGRTALISVLLLPGVGISGYQYRQARVAVPIFMACFLVAAALGNLQAARGGDSAEQAPGSAALGEPASSSGGSSR
jgi:Glycosyltransferase family 87